MDKEELRLEILKLVYNHGKHPKDSIVTAKILEEYVLNNSPEFSEREVEKADPKKVSSSKVKRVGNSDLLS